MADGHWKRLALSSVLLAASLLLAGGVIAVIGSTVLPQAGLFVWAAVALLAFLLFQLVVFRVMGLRSSADERPAGPGTAFPADDEAPMEDAPPRTGSERGAAPDSVDADDAEEAHRDWRAWRG